MAKEKSSILMEVHLSHRLFAMELMHCVMRKYSLRYHLKRLHNFDYGFNANYFTKNIAEAVSLLVPTFTNFDCDTFMSNGDTNQQRFITLANSLFTTLFWNGFNEKDFLIYCIHVAKMATRSYLHGVSEAPDYAVEAMVEAMEYFYTNLDLNDESWVEMDQVAKEIVDFGGL